MTQILEKYETPNITLATMLYSLSIPLSHVTLSGRNGNLGIFHFTNVPAELLTGFDQGVLRVEPQVFHMYLRRLTAMVKGVING